MDNVDNLRRPLGRSFEKLDKVIENIFGKMKNKTTYDNLIELAKSYNVQDNALFVSAAKQYDVQMKVIDMIQNQLEDDGSAVSTKEYVKGRENVYANPLIKELPKHSDSANRTLQTMLDIITKLGHKTETESALSKFEKEFS